VSVNTSFYFSQPKICEFWNLHNLSYRAFTVCMYTYIPCVCFSDFAFIKITVVISFTFINAESGTKRSLSIQSEKDNILLWHFNRVYLPFDLWQKERSFFQWTVAIFRFCTEIAFICQTKRDNEVCGCPRVKNKPDLVPRWS